jgi:UDP-N-acetylglucosamine 2-epimerase
MSNINDIKINTTLYQNKFIATDKQIDFILDNVTMLDDDKQEEKIMSEIENKSLTKADAAKIINKLIELLNYQDYGWSGDWWDYI